LILIAEISDYKIKYCKDVINQHHVEKQISKEEKDINLIKQKFLSVKQITLANVLSEVIHLNTHIFTGGNTLEVRQYRFHTGSSATHKKL